MSHLLIILLLVSSGTLAQTGSTFLHEHKNSKATVLYSYIQKNDSALLYGHIQERKTGIAILNINIIVKDSPIGTVPDMQGNFTLYLPSREGVILFDKPGSIRFDFPFQFKRDKLKVPSAHQ